MKAARRAQEVLSGSYWSKKIGSISCRGEEGGREEEGEKEGERKEEKWRKEESPEREKEGGKESTIVSPRPGTILHVDNLRLRNRKLGKIIFHRGAREPVRCSLLTG
jgi:hypothetical protein